MRMPSPRLDEKIQAAGVRPINNIVDITNFVMLETGQPMHAFDLRDVSGGKIVVRRARDGETMTTLDDGYKLSKACLQLPSRNRRVLPVLWDLLTVG